MRKWKFELVIPEVSDEFFEGHGTEYDHATCEQVERLVIDALDTMFSSYSLRIKSMVVEDD